VKLLLCEISPKTFSSATQYKLFRGGGGGATRLIKVFLSGSVLYFLQSVLSRIVVKFRVLKKTFSSCHPS
jgi:hypothetical protein